MKISLPFSNCLAEVSFNIKKHDSGVIRNRNFDKLFVIGPNKTGTTSMAYFLERIGLRVGNQGDAELIGLEYKKYGTVETIINYCHCYDAFQDVPFSTTDIYKTLDVEFPGSKFILTVRDSAEQWFSSLVNFHIKKFSSVPGSMPTADDLSNATYRYKGMALDFFRYYFDYPKVPLFDKEHYLNIYLSHLSDVKNYFNNRPDDFIVINISKINSFERTVKFLDIDTNFSKFPHRNRS